MSKNLTLEVSKFKFLAIAILAKLLASYPALADTSSADYIFLLSNEKPKCQQIDKKYIEVREFETENYYVNICRKNNQYYYLGASKIGKKNTIFVPANFLDLGEMYRAYNGNVVYNISILPHQAILTIERNGEKIAFESVEINHCKWTHNQSESSLKLLFEYSEKYLNSYATIFPDQNLSLSTKLIISEDDQFLDIDYLPILNSITTDILNTCR